MIFRKKKKKVILEERKPLSLGELYLSYASRYVSYQGKMNNVSNPLDNSDFYKQYAAPFYNSAMYFANYIDNIYTEDVLESNNIPEINISCMLQNASEENRKFFCSPKYPEIMHIKASDYTSHFHIKENIIEEAEDIHLLPGLSDLLANERINQLFVGLTPIEALALLEQMNICPKNSTLEQYINKYKEMKYVNEGFLMSIVCLLLIRRTKHSVTRARLFADSLGIDFDFSQFELNNAMTLKRDL